MLGFGKKKSEIAINRPVAGRILHMEDVPDPVFSSKLMGEGFAVEPATGSFVSPIEGELVLLADTLHAFAVRHSSGLEILVHIGVDTVKLKGDGFHSDRSTGDRLLAGDLIITVDLEKVGASAASLLTPVIITNGADFGILATNFAAGLTDPVLTVTKRS